MWYLLIVSVIWAFSFGLIKKYLPGLDPNLVAFLRLALASLVFLPFLRRRELAPSLLLRLVLLGGLQFGVMYVAYLASYRYLQAYQVALFTIITSRSRMSSPRFLRPARSDNDRRCTGGRRADTVALSNRFPVLRNVHLRRPRPHRLCDGQLHNVRAQPGRRTTLGPAGRRRRQADHLR